MAVEVAQDQRLCLINLMNILESQASMLYAEQIIRLSAKRAFIVIQESGYSISQA
jgi:hypothetical protein